ncbi:MAG TPA: hypothetical protein VK211_27430, partial [Kamptonema sp.]|nr:hypothetical protein [Kamptonema sp.]
GRGAGAVRTNPSFPSGSGVRWAGGTEATWRDRGNSLKPIGGDDDAQRQDNGEVNPPLPDQCGDRRSASGARSEVFGTQPRTNYKNSPHSKIRISNVIEMNLSLKKRL